MTDLETELAQFYDLQAPQRATREHDPRRVQRRNDFVELLRSEGRESILEIGTGTGQDSFALQESGFTVSGIDLSAENVRHCRERGIAARQGSLFEMPFEDGAFDAAWTMSTLLHVPNARLGAALAEIARVLRPGSPVAIGLWGGPDGERYQERSRDGIEARRFFSTRSDARLRDAFERHVAIEHFETWPDRSGDEHYQYCIVRTPMGD